MMEIYADTMLRMITFFDILPKQTRSPSGRKQISVTQKISTVIPIPLISWCNITLKLMLFLLYSKEKRVQNVPSVLSVFYFYFYGLLCFFCCVLFCSNALCFLTQAKHICYFVLFSQFVNLTSFVKFHNLCPNGVS